MQEPAYTIRVRDPHERSWRPLTPRPLLEISADDPLAIASAVFALLLAACVAGIWPARRATRLAPAVTLRAE